MNKLIGKIVYRLEEIKDDTNKSCSKVDIKKCSQYKDCGVCLVDRIIDIVKQLAEEYNGGWIPCSERLPEESLNSVIGWDEYRNRCCFVQYLNGRWVLGNDIDSVKITAWIPLPDPYIEK